MGLMVAKITIMVYTHIMHKVWNKGFTKESHPSVLKISQTMRKKKIDNFSEWRKEAKQKGLMRSKYPSLVKNEDLAELIGVVLGDGNIGKFPRTESLRIVANSKNKGFIKRYARIVKKVFNQKPSVRKRKDSNAVDIRIYQKFISKRLGIPSGAKQHLFHVVPQWVLADKKYVVRYLRGLYEAEGSVSYHKPTYTHKFNFSNSNQSLLKNVYQLMSQLGFRVNLNKTRVQISRKSEVEMAAKLLRFRKY